MTEPATLTFAEVGEVQEESQGLFAPETLPDDAIVYSRSWQAQRTDGVWVHITYYCAPLRVDWTKATDGGQESGGYDLQEATEFLLSDYALDDMENNWAEIDSDILWDNPNYELIPTVEQANAEARRYVAGFDVDLYIHVYDTTDRSVRING